MVHIFLFAGRLAGDPGALQGVVLLVHKEVVGDGQLELHPTLELLEGLDEHLPRQHPHPHGLPHIVHITPSQDPIPANHHSIHLPLPLDFTTKNHAPAIPLLALVHQLDRLRKLYTKFGDFADFTVGVGDVVLLLGAWVGDPRHFHVDPSDVGLGHVQLLVGQALRLPKPHHVVGQGLGLPVGPRSPEAAGGVDLVVLVPDAAHAVGAVGLAHRVAVQHNGAIPRALAPGVPGALPGSGVVQVVRGAGNPGHVGLRAN
mmetsp:Transcript_91374/g.209385  ORF Transcript_91374/g.209385 Transcript_91374/m.209385 type:complete len:258 (-) Transcript_91374:393-1166(-)